MKNSKYFVPVVLAIVSGCTTAPPSKVDSVPKPTMTPPPVEITAAVALPGPFVRKGVSVKVEEIVEGTDGMPVGVRGVAKNVTATDLKFCEIAFSGRDAAGQIVNNAKVITKSLKAGDTWHFQAALSSSTAAPVRSIATERVVAIPVKTQAGSLASNGS